MCVRTPLPRGQTRSYVVIALYALPMALLIFGLGCSGSSRTTVDSASSTISTDVTELIDRSEREGTAITRSAPGDPLPELSVEERSRFDEGKTVFITEEDPDEGLGPVFNGRSCAECHRQGAIGGAAFDQTVSVVTRFGGLVDGKFSDLPELGGAVMQRRSIHEIDPAFAVRPEIVPAQAKFVSRRTTTPLFGLGLIAAIPDSTLLKLADPDDKNRDGISGRVNRVFNPETKKEELGRFGWKSQVSSLTVFAADAYLNEMGITTPLFPVDLLPQGKVIPGLDTVPEPEDDGEDVERFADFMRLLAPPFPDDRGNTEMGRQTFNRIGCVSCHVSQLATGENPSPALSRKRVALYSDLLLHDLGAGLADGVRQGEASGNEFRTAPLWGIRYRKFLLHDGRARSIPEAIGWHGGEAGRVQQRYLGLSQREKEELNRFVDAL